nr:MAG TPA: hypothetical protein [Caudoviricetes sp.]
MCRTCAPNLASFGRSASFETELVTKLVRTFRCNCNVLSLYDQFTTFFLVNRK